MDEYYELRPGEGWLFVQPIDKENNGIIQRVSYGMDTCLIGRECVILDESPIQVRELGFIATRLELITIKEPE